MCGFQVQLIGKLLNIEGSGGQLVLYLEYVEIHLKIPDIKNYKGDCLLTVSRAKYEIRRMNTCRSRISNNLSNCERNED